jgi:fused signal recognition particle receptor
MLGLFKKSEKAEDESSWFNRLKTGLRATGSRMAGLLVPRKIDESLFEELETALLMSDAGVQATADLMAALRECASRKRLESAEQLRDELRDLLVKMLSPMQASLDVRSVKPFTIMIAGVNGAGKTTSIGKIASFLGNQGLSIMLAAGDTFRAAAREQLAEWGARNNIAVVSQQGADAASVIFDGVQSARAKNVDVLIADTAGRLHTQLHLMEELKKIKRVITKADPSAPHAVWLVLDANTGQNALVQFRAFNDALGLTGLILTKLDGTAKGGVLLAIARDQANGRVSKSNSSMRGTGPVPILFVGVGEGLTDLRPFDAREFADALLG